MALRGHLEKRWAGRGPAMILNDRAAFHFVKAARSGRPVIHWRRELLRAAVHELAHIVSRPLLPGELDDNLPRAEEKIKCLRACCSLTTPPAIETPCPWENHSADFIRIAQHAGHRMQSAVGFFLPREWVNTRDYGLDSGEWKYQTALGNEPERLAVVPLSEIVHIPPPVQFIELWRSDCRAWFQSLHSPTAEQSAALVRGLK